MKNLDELLNSFVDGELNPRERTEVERLMSHDEQISFRVQELQKYKTLLGSLPCAKAPADMTENIITAINKTSLPDQQPLRVDRRQGVRHLLFRKIVTAAAMICLIAVLAAVIYTILAPDTATESPIAYTDWLQPTEKIKIDTPKPVLVATAEKTSETVFNGRVELRTDNLAALDAFVYRTIQDNGLLDSGGSKLDANKSRYIIRTSREGLALLLADLNKVWLRFDSARLFVEANTTGALAVVEKVTTQQIVQVANYPSFEKRVKAAKDIAFLNTMADQLPGKELFAAIDSGKTSLVIPPPKPVLTGEMIKKPITIHHGPVQVELTIVVIGSK